MTPPELKFHWFLPTGGDGRSVGSVTAVQARSGAATERAPSLAYLTQVAQAAESAGFDAVLTPVGLGCEDPWMFTAALAARTTRLRYLVAFRPGLTHPAWLAHQTASLQRLSDDRILLNVVTGGDPVEQRALGDGLPHDDRYDRTDEFLEVFGRVWQERDVLHAGRFYQVEGGGLHLEGRAMPPIYFGGSSPPAERTAARHADVHLSWGEPAVVLHDRVERLKAQAAQVGRQLRFGVRLHVIARATSAAAWEEAERLLADMDDEAIEAARRRFATMDSTAQARMSELHGWKRHGLEIAPNLWAGIGLVREGAATALVGSYDEVAARLLDYRDAGFEEFVLSGYPHLEEALHIGECVVPRLQRSAVAA